MAGRTTGLKLRWVLPGGGSRFRRQREDGRAGAGRAGNGCGGVGAHRNTVVGPDSDWSASTTAQS